MNVLSEVDECAKMKYRNVTVSKLKIHQGTFAIYPNLKLFLST